jgi:hypothetical protein
MGFNKIGFLATIFTGMTLLNRIIEGAFITASDISIMNTLTLTRDQTILGLFTIPVINTNFFFVGIPRLVKWDYSFFGGNAAIWQYFLYSITFALTFFLFVVLIGMVSQYFGRR